MYSQKLLYSATKTTKDAVKVASKSAIQKTAEATGDLIGNKIADKVTKVSQEKTNNEIPKEKKKYIYISPEERQQRIDELRLK